MSIILFAASSIVNSIQVWKDLKVVIIISNAPLSLLHILYYVCIFLFARKYWFIPDSNIVCVNNRWKKRTYGSKWAWLPSCARHDKSYVASTPTNVEECHWVANLIVESDFRKNEGDGAESSLYLACDRWIFLCSMDFSNDDANGFESEVKCRLGYYLNTVKLHLYELVG